MIRILLYSLEICINFASFSRRYVCTREQRKTKFDSFFITVYLKIHLQRCRTYVIQWRCTARCTNWLFLPQSAAYIPQRRIVLYHPWQRTMHRSIATRESHCLTVLSAHPYRYSSRERTPHYHTESRPLRIRRHSAAGAFHDQFPICYPKTPLLSMCAYLLVDRLKESGADPQDISRLRNSLFKGQISVLSNVPAEKKRLDDDMRDI